MVSAPENREKERVSRSATSPGLSAPSHPDHASSRSLTSTVPPAHIHGSSLLKLSEVAQSCPTLCDPMVGSVAYQFPPSMRFSRQEYWGGLHCHFLLQEIFPTQGLNPGLPHGRHCRQMFYHLSHQRRSILYTSLFSIHQNYELQLILGLHGC